MAVVGFIPARGGSERIPRKNLRTVHGVPLIARTISILKAAGIDQVIVSTEDDEIARIAELWGAILDVRRPELAGPDVTITQVVDDYVARHLWGPGQLLAVAQPTSPLLTPATVANAVTYAKERGESVFTAVAERGMLWSPSTVPLYDGPRRNSTTPGSPSYYRETGGLVVFAPAERGHGDNWPPFPRTLMEIEDAEGIDIDDYSDLVRARAGQKPARIQLRYVESFELGSGHRRRCEALAIELMGRHIVEVVEHTKAPLPSFYDVMAYEDHAERLPDYDLVILDILDTKVQDVQGLYDNGVEYVITLEDLGLGASLADLTINELYAPSTAAGVASYGADRWGPRWAVLRPEFQGHPFRERRRPNPAHDERMDSEFNQRAKATIVVSFGGTDPHNMTEYVVDQLRSIKGVGGLRVIAPPGRDVKLGLPEGLTSGMKLSTVRNAFMAREFLEADLAITSSGRTVHEAAACGCPVVAIPVNDREKLHGVCPGVHYMPAIDASFIEGLLGDEASLGECARLAYDAVDGLGAQRIAYLVDGLLGGML